MKAYQSPIPGVEIWDNEKNGFTVFQLHYSADPKKKLPGAMKHIEESMPTRQYKQEYELVWDSFEGLSVYGDWDQKVHTVREEPFPHLGLPIFLGVDFGLTPAMIVCQLQEEALVVFREFTAVNMGAERFMQLVGPKLTQLYPQWADRGKDYVVFIDPSGHFRKDTDETTCAQVIARTGFRKIIPGAISWEERRQSVEYYLTRRNKEGSCFKVYAPNCPVLIQGFQGGYRYPDKALDREPNKLRPVKDQYSHVHDALQMVCCKLVVKRRASIGAIPTPNYSWGGGQSTIS